MTKDFCVQANDLFMILTLLVTTDFPSCQRFSSLFSTDTDFVFFGLFQSCDYFSSSKVDGHASFFWWYVDSWFHMYLSCDDIIILDIHNGGSNWFIETEEKLKLCELCICDVVLIFFKIFLAYRLTNGTSKLEAAPLLVLIMVINEWKMLIFTKWMMYLINVWRC